LFLSHGDIKTQQYRGGRVDGHGGGDVFERDLIEERFHVFQRINRHADFTDLAERQRVIGIHADLRGKIERHRKPHLPLLRR